jgi:hypothetical protein
MSFIQSGSSLIKDLKVPRNYAIFKVLRQCCRRFRSSAMWHRWVGDSGLFEGTFSLNLQGLEDEGRRALRNVGDLCIKPKTQRYIIENLNILSSNCFLQKTFPEMSIKINTTSKISATISEFYCYANSFRVLLSCNQSPVIRHQLHTTCNRLMIC